MTCSGGNIRDYGAIAEAALGRLKRPAGGRQLLGLTVLANPYNRFNWAANQDIMNRTVTLASAMLRLADQTAYFRISAAPHL